MAGGSRLIENSSFVLAASLVLAWASAMIVGCARFVFGSLDETTMWTCYATSTSRTPLLADTPLPSPPA